MAHKYQIMACNIPCGKRKLRSEPINIVRCSYWTNKIQRQRKKSDFDFNMEFVSFFSIPLNCVGCFLFVDSNKRIHKYRIEAKATGGQLNHSLFYNHKQHFQSNWIIGIMKNVDMKKRNGSIWETSDGETERQKERKRERWRAKNKLYHHHHWDVSHSCDIALINAENTVTLSSCGILTNILLFFYVTFVVVALFTLSSAHSLPSNLRPSLGSISLFLSLSFFF